MSYPENFKSPPIVVEMIKKTIRGKKVCELGCGAGDLLLEIKKYAREVSGIEINREWCEEARKKGLNVICGDILTSEIPKADIYYLWVNHILRDKILKKIEKETEGRIIILGYNLDEVPHPFNKHGDSIFTIPASDENPEFKVSFVDRQKVAGRKSGELIQFEILSLIDCIRLKIKSLTRKVKSKF